MAPEIEPAVARQGRRRNARGLFLCSRGPCPAFAWPPTGEWSPLSARYRAALANDKHRYCSVTSLLNAVSLVQPEHVSLTAATCVPNARASAIFISDSFAASRSSAFALRSKSPKSFQMAGVRPWVVAYSLGEIGG